MWTPAKKRYAPSSQPRYAKRQARFTRRPALPLTIRPRSSRIEVKAWPYDGWVNSFVDLSLTGNLTAVPLGSANTNRTGRVVQGRELRWWLVLTADNPTISHAAVRVIFFRWNDDTDPEAQDILNDEQRITSTYNTQKQGKWKILSDRYYAMNSNTFLPGPGTLAAVTLPLSGTFKTNWQCTYDDEDNEQESGQVRCLILTDTDAVVRATMSSQFFYTDV